jgi:hypothetical protein
MARLLARLLRFVELLVPQLHTIICNVLAIAIAITTPTTLSLQDHALPFAMTPPFMDRLVLHQHLRDDSSASAGSQPLVIPPAHCIAVRGRHPNPDPNPDPYRNPRSPGGRLQGWFEQMSRNECVCKVIVTKSGGSRLG